MTAQSQHTAGGCGVTVRPSVGQPVASLSTLRPRSLEWGSVTWRRPLPCPGGRCGRGTIFWGNFVFDPLKSNSSIYRFRLGGAYLNIPTSFPLRMTQGLYVLSLWCSRLPQHGKNGNSPDPVLLFKLYIMAIDERGVSRSGRQAGTSSDLSVGSSTCPAPATAKADPARSAQGCARNTFTTKLTRTLRGTRLAIAVNCDALHCHWYWLGCVHGIRHACGCGVGVATTAVCGRGTRGRWRW